MKRNLKHLPKIAALAAVIATLCHVTPARAADLSGEDVQKLLQRINDLEQKVKILERNRELDQDAVTDKFKQIPSVTLGAEGLKVTSPDTHFTMIAHGYVQADGRYYLNSQKTVGDTFLLRRVRPIIEGTVFGNYDYRVMLDLASGTFGSTTSGNVPILDDAFVNARFTPNLQVQAGKFKSPIGLERLEATSNLQFVETGYATALTPNYDLGVELHNSLFKSPVDYAIGVFNGASDGGSGDTESSASDQGKDVVARVFTEPFIHSKNRALKGLGFGVAGSVGDRAGSAPPSYKTPGQQTFFSYTSGVTANGQQWRIDPQAFYYFGPFGLMAEYVVSSQEVQLAKNSRLNNSAWQVQASWFLTGEDNAYRASSLRNIAPLRNLALDGSAFGAFELVARAQQLTLDDNAFPTLASSTSARQATSWGVGINWYLNANLKLNFDYESTTFGHGKSGAGSATAGPEHAILSQVQFAF